MNQSILKLLLLTTTAIFSLLVFNFTIKQTYSVDTFLDRNFNYPDLYIQSSNRTSEYMFNCGNIHKINIKELIGSGDSKLGFLGEFEGVDVVVKYSSTDVRKMWKKRQRCLDTLEKKHILQEMKHICNDYADEKIMKEIIMMHGLEHLNIVKMLGYCVRSENKYSNDLETHGIISVFEYGHATTEATLKNLPWQERLRHIKELTSLLVYLENSPFGSLRYADMKLRHFIMVDSHLKVYDMDSVFNMEPFCKGSCKYNTECRNGRCHGFNAKFNLDNINKLVYQPLLFNKYPPEIADQLLNISEEFTNLSANLTSVLKRLRSIQEAQPGLL